MGVDSIRHQGAADTSFEQRSCDRGDLAMDLQRFAIGGRVILSDDPQLHEALTRAYESPTRPRCLCTAGGVEMYVARHRQFVIKRMPGTGHLHHAVCPSFEPEASQSGLGELVGQAVIEAESGRVELRVGFAWERQDGRSALPGEPHGTGEVTQPRRRMSLRGLMHFLFERAGFNRWSPAMEGKRNQGVLHKYLTEAAEDVLVKGGLLGDRLYVPEPFIEPRRSEAAQRRRVKLSILSPRDGHWPLAVVLGEFKRCDDTALGKRIWLRHMPDAPLLASNRLWERTARAFGPLFEARDADSGVAVRLLVAALIRARREQTYEVESVSMMLVSEHWIPVEGVHELPLIKALVAQRRRFVKPLRYDARSVAGFANALLTDAGPVAVPLHVLSPFMTEADRMTKERGIAAVGASAWVWSTERPMPALPTPRGLSTG